MLERRLHKSDCHLLVVPPASWLGKGGFGCLALVSCNGSGGWVPGPTRGCKTPREWQRLPGTVWASSLPQSRCWTRRQARTAWVATEAGSGNLAEKRLKSSYIWERRSHPTRARLLAADTKVPGQQDPGPSLGAYGVQFLRPLVAKCLVGAH